MTLFAFRRAVVPAAGCFSWPCGLIISTRRFENWEDAKPALRLCQKIKDFLCVSSSKEILKVKSLLYYSIKEIRSCMKCNFPVIQ